MKNNYRKLKFSILLQTVLVTALTVLVGGVLLKFVIDGIYNDSFARFFVDALVFLNVNEKTAIHLYWKLVGDNKTFYMIVGYLILFALFFYVALSQMTKYLDQIDHGIEYTHIALEKSIRLGELINEFFDITRYNLQNIELEPVEIDLTMMLEQLADELYGVLQEKKLTCEVDVEEDLMIYGDPDKLARVFDNILRNAIAYCYANTEIRIEAKIKDGDIEITFTNAGDKIPGDMLQTIFEKFYRVDGSRSTGTGGAGLGLAIAKQIVELHGGRILAKSDDNQTQFVVTLPSKEKTEQKEGSKDEVHTHRRLAFRGKTGRGKRLQSK